MRKEYFTPIACVTGLVLLGGCLGLFYGSKYEQKVQASATDRSGNVIMATGPVFVRMSSGVSTSSGLTNSNYSALEAVYLLDQNTGRLTAGVLSRDSQSFQGLYQTDLNAGLASVLNISSGNGPEAAKIPMPQNPRYTMVTGEVAVPSQSGAQWQVPQGVVYVHEQNTGYVMVYTIPWTADWASGRFVKGELQLWTACQFTQSFAQPAQ